MRYAYPPYIGCTSVQQAMLDIMSRNDVAQQGSRPKTKLGDLDGVLSTRTKWWMRYAYPPYAS